VTTLRLFAIVALVSSCGASIRSAEPFETRGIRIGRHDVLRRGALTKRVALPFGQGQNGDMLVRELLLRAQELGAIYVADLSFRMVFKWRGEVVECETKVGFRDELPPAVARTATHERQASDPYSTEVSSFEPGMVAYVADEKDLVCKEVSFAVHKLVPRHASLYDADVARALDEMPLESKIEFKSRDECELQRVKRAVTRYDFYAKLAYVPPKWDELAQHYADEPLVELPPVCYAIDPASLGPHPTHRFAATVVFRGAVEQREPLRLPSAGPER